MSRVINRQKGSEINRSGIVIPKHCGYLLLIVGIILLAGVSSAAGIVRPYERKDPAAASDPNRPANPIDVLMTAGLKKAGLEPTAQCSDEVFIRRVHVDLTGRLPEAQRVRDFLASGNPDKRSELIDSLMESEAFAEYWSLKWCDILRVKAEFPINLWPNAVQAYHRWIYESIRDNKSYDQFARQMLTSSGSNFRQPAVNFYRAIQGHEPSAIAGAVALTFMGSRIETWPAKQRAGVEAFFSRVGYKTTAEWKEEIVYLNPETSEPLEAVFPDGTAVVIAAGDDPRAVFADWLIRDDNPWFARAIVNRIWAWLLGRGLIHEPDDIRPDNLAVYPEVLACLEKELTKSNYDLRHIYRLICTSRTYQQSSIPRTDSPKAETLFACYPVRQLDAEVLIDALCGITGTQESYSSPIPEPFTFVPEEHRSIELSDGSMTSQFLEMFGRPARDTGLESERTNQPTDAQRLHMLNSTHVQDKIERSRRITTLVRSARGNRQRIIQTIYLNVLSRNPTKEELEIAKKYFQSSGLSPRQAAGDLVWALINTREFLFRH